MYGKYGNCVCTLNANMGGLNLTKAECVICNMQFEPMEPQRITGTYNLTWFIHWMTKQYHRCVHVITSNFMTCYTGSSHVHTLIRLMPNHMSSCRHKHHLIIISSTLRRSYQWHLILLYMPYWWGSLTLFARGLPSKMSHNRLHKTFSSHSEHISCDNTLCPSIVMRFASHIIFFYFLTPVPSSMAKASSHVFYLPSNRHSAKRLACL